MVDSRHFWNVGGGALVLLMGLFSLVANAQIAGGTNTDSQADVFWYRGDGITYEKWFSLVHDWSDNNAMEGRTVVASLCWYQNELYAGTDEGRVYKYLGETTWQETGQPDDSMKSFPYPVAALVVHNGQLYAGLSYLETGTDGDYNGRPNLYWYDKSNETWIDLGELASQTVDGTPYSCNGIGSLYSWGALYIGDSVNDHIWSASPDTTSANSVFEHVDTEEGSCIWDFEPFTLGAPGEDPRSRLYAAAYFDQIYVRRDAEDPPGPLWIRPDKLDEILWELETFNGNLYSAWSFGDTIRNSCHLLLRGRIKPNSAYGPQGSLCPCSRHLLPAQVKEITGPKCRLPWLSTVSTRQ